MLSSLLSIPLFAGIILTLAGFLMRQFPPKKINAFYGYRTSSSMKSQERWDFAQTYSSKEMTKVGLILAACSLSGFMLKENNAINPILQLVIIISAIATLFLRVEKAIKKEFGNN